VTIRMFQRLALLLAAVAAAALLVLNGLAWTGGHVSEPGAEPEAAFVPEPAAPRPKPARQQVARKRFPAPEPATVATALTITATRGDCWTEVRAGSSTGPVLYAGLLASGSTLKFNRDRLWLRLGASSNVDIMVNGRPSSVPSGTVELTLPARA
jgi:Domain of unknown function (DUF4115)